MFESDGKALADTVGAEISIRLYCYNHNDMMFFSYIRPYLIVYPHVS